jgi:hypothetical protein
MSLKLISKSRIVSKTARILIPFGPMATLAFAQSGTPDLSPFIILGTTILKALVAVTGIAFVGLIVCGGLTLATNRPRGLAMVGGGLTGALLSGLAYTLVDTLTGRSVSSHLITPVVNLFLS